MGQGEGELMRPLGVEIGVSYNEEPLPITA